jgi:hypothetical protein
MQTHGGQAAEDAILSADRYFVVDVKVDWDKDGSFSHPLSDLSAYSDNLTTDRSLAGSAPEEILLIEGASAAELSFSVDGVYGDRSLGFDAVFSPYNGYSPFYGQDIMGAEVIYRIGIETAVGVIWYPQFVGNVRTITPDRATGNVEITALDRVELLRRPVQFPPWAISQYHTARGNIESQLANSQSLIDHCLRSSDVSPTPWRAKTKKDMNLPPTGTTDGCLFWLNGTGSYNPTIGWHARTNYNIYPEVDNASYGMYDQQGQQHQDVVGETPKPLNFVSYPTGSGDLRSAGYWVANREDTEPGGTHFLGMTLILNGTNSDHPYSMLERYLLKIELEGNLLYEIVCAAGQVWARLTNLSTNITNATSRLDIPANVDHCEVRAAWRVAPEGTDDTGYLRVGSATTGRYNVGTTGKIDYAFNPEAGLVSVNNDIAFNDAYYSFRNTSVIYLDPSSGSGEAHSAKYAAVLDKGIQDYTFLPVRDGIDAWDVITQVAAAEHASVFWDEGGVFRFWNAERLESLKQSPVRTLTLDDVSNLSITNSLDSVRNIWSVEASKRVGAYGICYASNDVNEFYFEFDGARKYFRVWSDDAVAIEPYRVRRYTSAEWNDKIVHGYVVQWLVDGVWQENDTWTAGVDINTYYTASGEFEVNMWNYYNHPCRFAIDDDTPALTLGGVKIQSFPPQVTSFSDQDSINKYGARNYHLSGDWVQDRFSLNALNNHMMGRTLTPIPTTDAVTVAGDPRHQLGDCLEVLDPDGFGESMKIQTYGINRTLSRDTGLTDTLTIEMVKPPGGVWDSPQYGRWDESFIWSA